MGTIYYRPANKRDTNKIARLHAKSWQDHYRGIWEDDYLDNKVLEERLKVWKLRFSRPNPKQYALIATNGEKIVGFACTFLDYEKPGEALLDNIHVLKNWQGKGIGRRLFKASLEWVFTQNSNRLIYLLVLAENKGAISFYKKMKGIRKEKSMFKNPDGSVSEVIRYEWLRMDVVI